MLNAAIDNQIDDAGRDRFPSAGVMVDGLEKVGFSLTHVKQSGGIRCAATLTPVISRSARG